MGKSSPHSTDNEKDGNQVITVLFRSATLPYGVVK